MFRQKIDKLFADYRLVCSQVQTESAALLDADCNEAHAEEAQARIQLVAQTIQEEAHDKIASVVSRCIEAVFDDPYEFKIEFEKKRGRTEAVLTLVRGGLVLRDPSYEAGGGVIDVASFALRLACLVLERPIRRRLLVLDEPFKGIRGEKNRLRMRALLESLSEEFDVQFITCVDHEVFPQFLLGHVVEVGGQ